jgi:hypothetical protein
MVPAEETRARCPRDSRRDTGATHNWLLTMDNWVYAVRLRRVER